jgi:hypothetical protein
MPSTKTLEVGPKLYVNGFPKSGTHLLDSMAMCLLTQADSERNWMGNMDNDGFGTDFIYLDTFPKMLEEMPDRRYVKGHLGWEQNIVNKFIDNRWCKVFIFRDFRDVAVSMAYHAQRDKEGTQFPNKDEYEAMEYDEVLTRVITGDENVSGVMDRWELYAPWLDEDWVLKLDYGNVIDNKELACELLIRYLYGRLGRYYGRKLEIPADHFNYLMHRMMNRLAKPEKSPTYRNGKTGDWKKHFTDEHKELFKESDKNNWLIRLGYTNDRTW